MSEELTNEPEIVSDEDLVSALEDGIDELPEAEEETTDDDRPVDSDATDDEPADDDGADEPEESEPEEEETKQEVEPQRITVGGREFEIPGDAPEPVKQAVEAIQTVENDLKASYTEKTQGLERAVEQRAADLKTEQDIAFSQQQLQQLQQLEAMYEHASVFATHEQLAQLAETDPAEYQRQLMRNQAVQERRQYVQQHIQSVAQRLEQQRQTQEAEAMRRASEHERAEMDKLAQEGITRSSIESIFVEASKHYGVEPEHFHGRCDAILVKAIADANKYRALQDKARSTKKRVQKVAKQPQRKQPPRDGAGRFKGTENDIGAELIAGVWE